jgi:hypothetical protein
VQLLQARSCGEVAVPLPVEQKVLLFSRDVDITMLLTGCDTIYKILCPESLEELSSVLGKIVIDL